MALFLLLLRLLVPVWVRSMGRRRTKGDKNRLSPSLSFHCPPRSRQCAICSAGLSTYAWLRNGCFLRPLNREFSAILSPCPKTECLKLCRLCCTSRWNPEIDGKRVELIWRTLSSDLFPLPFHYMANSAKGRNEVYYTLPVPYA